MSYRSLTDTRRSPMRNLTMWRIAIWILSITMFLGAQSLDATAPNICVVGKPIASKRSKDVVMVLMNENGKFTGGANSLCVEFRNADDGGPVDVRSVSMDFSQLVGRIQQRPIMAQITQDSVGKYRGRVNLGRQYYNPAAYYAVVHYLDLTGKERKVRFLLAVK
jgi:hypothetical protein